MGKGSRALAAGRKLSRREALQTLALAAGGIGVAGTLNAWASGESLTIANSGGSVGDGQVACYVKPFQQATGINYTMALRDSVEGTAATQVKVQVETKRVQWDVVTLGGPTVVLLRDQNLVDSLERNKYDYHDKDLLPGTLEDDYAGLYVVALVVAYRSDKYSGADVPKTFADFWNTSKFPGRRGVFKSAMDLMEPAVLSAGVPPAKLYPLDVDLAFQQLTKIKPNINAWWDNLAQSTQAIKDGDVDLAITFNARAQPAIDAGAPARLAWGQWIAQTVGAVIPKGAPHADIARRYISFITQPGPQAALTKYVKYGPTNRRAYGLVDPKIADQLPGSALTRAGLIPVDGTWRARNTGTVTDRFTAWLVS